MSAHPGCAEAAPAPGELSDYLLLTVCFGVHGDLGRTKRISLRMLFSPGSRDSWGLPVHLCALAMHNYLYNSISNFPGNTGNLSLLLLSWFCLVGSFCLFGVFLWRFFGGLAFFLFVCFFEENVARRAKPIFGLFSFFREKKSYYLKSI